MYTPVYAYSNLFADMNKLVNSRLRNLPSVHTQLQAELIAKNNELDLQYVSGSFAAVELTGGRYSQ